jgi:hypothetical protein
MDTLTLSRILQPPPPSHALNGVLSPERHKHLYTIEIVPRERNRPNIEDQTAMSSSSHSSRTVRDHEHGKILPGLWSRIRRWIVGKKSPARSTVEPNTIEPSIKVELSTIEPSINRLGIFDPNIFNKLPPELWLDIIEFLSPASAASLTYTCRWMYNQYGERPCSILKLPGHEQDKLELLSYLDADLPKHRLCHPCAIFHRRKSLGAEQKEVKANYGGCWIGCERRAGETKLGTGYSLTWPSIRSVMRACRFGPEYGMSLDVLARVWENDDGWKHRAEPSIVNGRLLMKVQSALPVDWATESIFKNRISDIMRHSWLGCLQEIVKCALHHIRSDESYTIGDCFCKSLRRCPECPTEYMIETKRISNISGDMRKSMEARGVQHVLIVTKWMDYGEGKSPLSPEWQALATCNSFSPLDQISTCDIRNIRSRFERSIGNYAEDLPVLESLTFLVFLTATPWPEELAGDVYRAYRNRFRNP